MTAIISFALLQLSEMPCIVSITSSIDSPPNAAASHSDLRVCAGPSMLHLRASATIRYWLECTPVLVTEANVIHIASSVAPATVNGNLASRFVRHFAAVLLGALVTIGSAHAQSPTFDSFAVPAGSAPHDVAPSPDGTVWYTAQARGVVGRLDPRNGKTDLIPLGNGSAPHGVIVGPDRAAWITDGGLNAIVRVDPKTLAVTTFPLPKDRQNANLNTAVFDKRGHLCFTWQGGIYGDIDPQSGKIRVFDPRHG